MTIACPDSIRPGDLPAGYPAYLGYADGNWPTGAQLHRDHPAARIIVLTVTGRTIIADGCDCETGDLSPASAAAWAKRALDAGNIRPVIYASVSTWAGPLIAALDAEAIPVHKVRVLTAHYTHQAHICGPDSCGELPWDADGTQWTDQFSGHNGAIIDMSQLSDAFFGATVAPAGLSITGHAGFANAGWGTVLGATRYELAVKGKGGAGTGTTPALTITTIVGPVSTGTHAPDIKLAAGWYVGKVRAGDGHTWGPWSAEREFLVMRP